MDLGKYRVIKLIGRGGFGRVFEGSVLETGINVVIKLIPISKIEIEDLDNLDNEISSLKKLSDANAQGSNYVVKYIDDFYYKNDQSIFHAIVMEDLNSWANLKEFIKVIISDNPSDPKISTHVIDTIIGNLINGLKYIHQNGMAHRDIKLENIMIDSFYNIKYIDLGLACSFKCGQKRGGTILYMPLEILNKNFTNYIPQDEYIIQQNLLLEQAHDIWSLGILIYRLANLTQYPYNYPFDKKIIKNENDLIQELTYRHYNTPSSYNREYEGPDINFMIEAMLNLDVTNRPSIIQLSQYFFNNLSTN